MMNHKGRANNLLKPIYILIGVEALVSLVSLASMHILVENVSILYGRDDLPFLLEMPWLVVLYLPCAMFVGDLVFKLYFVDASSRSFSFIYHMVCFALMCVSLLYLLRHLLVTVTVT